MDYHDFVIKDGKFIGKFDEMYRACDNPWNQSDDVIQSYQKMACLSSISRIKPNSVLEVGCGLGYYTNFLARMFPDVQFEGMDISETAVKKARDVFPDVKFSCGNIAEMTDLKHGGGGMMLSYSQKYCGTSLMTLTA